MRPSLLVSSLLCVLGATQNLLGQSVTTNAPTKSPRSTFPYKKDGRLVARFSWTDPQPMSAALTAYQVRDFQVETFSPDGTPNLMGEAPQCQFNTATKSVSSAGPLKVSQVGGLFSLAGEGFEWNHESGRLVLSNRVHTVVRLNVLPIRPSTPLLP